MFSPSSPHNYFIKKQYFQSKYLSQFPLLCTSLSCLWINPLTISGENGFSFDFFFFRPGNYLHLIKMRFKIKYQEKFLYISGFIYSYQMCCQEWSSSVSLFVLHKLRNSLGVTFFYLDIKHLLLLQLVPFYFSS